MANCSSQHIMQKAESAFIQAQTRRLIVIDADFKTSFACWRLVSARVLAVENKHFKPVLDQSLDMSGRNVYKEFITLPVIHAILVMITCFFLFLVTLYRSKGQHMCA